MPVTMMTSKFVTRDGTWYPKEQPEGAFEVSYAGAVLDVRERNGYDDSDFYAVVWDGEKLLEVEYGTTRAWTYPNHASIDASDEVLVQVRAWLAPILIAQVIGGALARNADPAVMDRKVKVVRGRKVEHGTVGEVDLINRSQFNAEKRLRIRLLDGSHVWSAAANCEAADPEPVDEAAIAQRIQDRLADANGTELARIRVSMTYPGLVL